MSIPFWLELLGQAESQGQAVFRQPGEAFSKLLLPQRMLLAEQIRVDVTHRAGCVSGPRTTYLLTYLDGRTSRLVPGFTAHPERGGVCEKSEIVFLLDGGVRDVLRYTAEPLLCVYSLPLLLQYPPPLYILSPSLPLSLSVFFPPSFPISLCLLSSFLSM